KYDEVTDDIIRRFFDVAPPRFLVLSGTLHLPLPVFPVSRAQRARLARELRELRYNPQRHLDTCGAMPPRLQALAEEKNACIARGAAGAVTPAECHRQLRRLNAQMAPFFEGVRTHLSEEIELLDHQIGSN